MAAPIKRGVMKSPGNLRACTLGASARLSCLLQRRDQTLPTNCIGGSARIGRPLQDAGLRIDPNCADRASAKLHFRPPGNLVAQAREPVPGLFWDSCFQVEASRVVSMGFRRAGIAVRSETRSLNGSLRIHSECDDIEEELKHGLRLDVIAW